MASYLSIDLDYWLTPNSENRPPIWGLFKLLRKVANLPCRLVEEHHEILDHIEKFDVDSIIHVDYHQDIAFPIQKPKLKKNGFNTLKSEDQYEIYCGNFFWFLKNRKEMSFNWFYPETDCPKYDGLCIDPRYKPHSQKNWIFKTQKKKKGLPTLNSLNDVVAVGIACSTEYCLSGDDVNRLEAILLKRYLHNSPDFQDYVNKHPIKKPKKYCNLR